MKVFLFLSFYFGLMGFSNALVRVAFIEAIDQKGEHYVLEKDGRFFHLALQIENGLWLQSHPAFGTILTKNLDGMGYVSQVLESKEITVTYEEIKPLLGQPFDKSYSFKSKVSSYCSKLVGQVLDIPPKKRMKFEGEIWKYALVKRNQPGWSPDYIYNYLLAEMNYKPLIPLVVQRRPSVDSVGLKSCRGVL